MSPEPASYRGDDELLFGIILGCSRFGCSRRPH